MDEADSSLDGPEAEGAGVAVEPLADRLRRQGAELVAALPASRWQVKVRTDGTTKPAQKAAA